MNLIAATIPGLIAAGLLVGIRRGWVPRGPLAALAQIAALLALISMAALVIGPYAD